MKWTFVEIFSRSGSIYGERSTVHEWKIVDLKHYLWLCGCCWVFPSIIFHFNCDIYVVVCCCFLPSPFSLRNCGEPLLQGEALASSQFCPTHHSIVLFILCIWNICLTLIFIRYVCLFVCLLNHWISCVENCLFLLFAGFITVLDEFRRKIRKIYT